MDKKTFISELRQALSVLQEDELEDIISEYEQHIDMKQKDGLTEEDAIADFGSLNELAAEILEAYHVRADYASGQKSGKRSFFTGEKIGQEESPRQSKKLLTQAGKAISRGIHSLAGLLWRILLLGRKIIAQPFVWLKEWRESRWSRQSYEEPYQEEIIRIDSSEDESPAARKTPGRQKSRESRKSQESPMLTGIGILFAKLKNLLLSVIRLTGRTVLWGMRMAWNAGCMCFALFCGCCGLFSLYILGLLTVLLMQRYPLAGLTLGCLGLVLCFFSAAGLGITLLWRGKREIRSTGRGSDMTKDTGIGWPERSGKQSEKPENKKDGSEMRRQSQREIFARRQENPYNSVEGGQHA